MDFLILFIYFNDKLYFFVFVGKLIPNRTFFFNEVENRQFVIIKNDLIGSNGYHFGPKILAFHYTCPDANLLSIA